MVPWISEPETPVKAGCLQLGECMVEVSEMDKSDRESDEQLFRST